MKPWQIITAIGIGSFLGVVVVCGGVGTWFVITVNRQMSAINPMINGGSLTPTVPGITYTMSMPEQSVQGERFTITCTVVNTLSTTQTLHSLQNYSSLRIHAADPAPQSDGGGPMLVYNTVLPPNQPQTFLLEASSDTTGWVEVNIDANIGGPTNLVEGWQTIEIVSAEQATPGPPIRIEPE